MLDLQNPESTEDLKSMHNVYIKVEIPFSCWSIYFHIPKSRWKTFFFLDSTFTLDQIIDLHKDFHKLALKQGSCYIESLEQIALKKAVISPKSNDEQCLNGKLLQHYIIKSQYNQ